MNEEMNEEMNNTIENTTEEATELEEREELRNELDTLEDEPEEEKDNLGMIEGITKLGIGFAAGYAAGRIHANVKTKKEKEPAKKDHFWNRIHFQNPIKIEKKQEQPVGESKDDSEETKKNPENTQTPGKDQENK